MAFFSSTRLLIGATSILFYQFIGIEVKDLFVLKGFQFLIIFLFEVPIGYFSDRISRKLSLQLSIFFAVLWMGITGFAQSSYWLYAGEFFNGLSLASMSGAFESILIQEKQKNITIEKLFGKVKYIIFLTNIFFIVISFFLSDYNLSLVWKIGSLLLLIQLICFSRFIPQDSSYRSNDTFIFINIKKIFNKFKLSMLVLILIGLFTSLAIQFLIQYWQLIFQGFLINLEIDSRKLYSVMFLFILMVQSISGLLLKKKDFSYWYLGMLLLLASVLFIIEMTINMFMLTPIIILLYFFSIATINTKIMANINEYIPNDIRSTYLSLQSMCFRLFLFLFSILLPLLFDTYQYYIFVFITIMIVTFLIFYKSFFTLTA